MQEEEEEERQTQLQVALAVCGSYGTPFSLEGVQAETYQRQLSKLSLSPKAAPGYCECVCDCVCVVGVVLMPCAL